MHQHSFDCEEFFLQSRLSNNVFFLFTCRTMAARAKVMADWVSEGGVLLMGYRNVQAPHPEEILWPQVDRRKPRNVYPVIIDLDEEDRQQWSSERWVASLGKCRELPGERRRSALVPNHMGSINRTRNPGPWR